VGYLGKVLIVFLTDVCTLFPIIIFAYDCSTNIICS